MTQGRPRKIDPEIALESAMKTFWEKGYEATSVADLVDATGLHKGSLYQTFGDKHDLFCTALKHYLNKIHTAQAEAMQPEADPIERIQQGYRAVMKFSECANNERCGCLAINSMIEFMGRESEAEGILLAHRSSTLELLASAFAEAQILGMAPKNKPAELLAQMLLTFLAGLAVMSKSEMTLEQGFEMMDQQLQLLCQRH